MKIGFVHSRRDSPLPFQPKEDRVCFGPFVSIESVPAYCPRIYFEFPILRPVTAIVWNAPTATGEYIGMQLFDWSRCDKLGEIEECAGETFGFVPQYAQIEESPPRELRQLLKCAKEYWEPFTSLKAAPKLLPTLLSMSENEITDFLEKLGQSRNQRTLRVRREKFFIANRWDQWERCEAGYDERVKDMVEHGLPINLAAFKKRVGKREMDLPHRYRE